MKERKLSKEQTKYESTVVGIDSLKRSVKEHENKMPFPERVQKELNFKSSWWHLEGVKYNFGILFDQMVCYR